MSTSTIQPCFPNLVSLAALVSTFFSFPFLSSLSSSCFPSSLSYSSSSSHLFIFFLSFPFFFSFLSPSFWKKEKMTPTLRPSLWFHHQPATSSSPLPVGLKVPGSGRDHWVGRIGFALHCLSMTHRLKCKFLVHRQPTVVWPLHQLWPYPPLYFHFSLLWLSLYKL